MRDIRLIDANALKEVIETYRPVKCFTDKDIGKNRMVDYCLSEIDNAPTVEMPNWYKVYEDVKDTFERPQCNQIAWEQGYEAGLAQAQEGK